MNSVMIGFSYVVSIIFLLAAGSFLMLPLQSHARDSQLQPGVYITEKGWGTLIIKKNNAGGLTFSIETVGANTHTCSLEGNIKNGQSVLESSEKGKPCVVTFVPQGHNIQVTPSGFECQYYCGARAHFESLYMKQPKSCDPFARQQTRNEFKRLYDKKSYAAARVKLETLLDNCSTFIGWI
jgi:hypothetical protein